MQGFECTLQIKSMSDSWALFLVYHELCQYTIMSMSMYCDKVVYYATHQLYIDVEGGSTLKTQVQAYETR